MIRCTKRFAFAAERAGYRIDCTSTLSLPEGQVRFARVGVEMVLNFLAPREPDRYFEIASKRQPLGWSGAVSAAENGPRLRVVDEWQNVAATIEAPAAREFWIAPIETISESEEGFERVYQGSQILVVWPLELLTEKSWAGEVSLRVERARPAESGPSAEKSRT